METELILKPDGFKTWKLVKDFTQQTSQGEITVPKDSRTDLASVPRMFWMLIPPFGRYSQAAVVHDHLYHTGYDKYKADKIFYELMLRYGTYKWKAKIMYWAVFIFGGRAWQKKLEGTENA